MPEFYREQNYGWMTLKKTGLVPKGAELLTNVRTGIPAETLRRYISEFKSEGFKVFVIKGLAYAPDGQKVDGDAIVGIRKNKIIARFLRAETIDPDKVLEERLKKEVQELESGQTEENDSELHALQRELDRLKSPQVKG